MNATIKKILNVSLVLLLALGLGGCTTIGQPTTHSTNPTNTQATVKSNHHQQSSKKQTNNSKVTQKQTISTTPTTISSSSLNQPIATTSTTITAAEPTNQPTSDYQTSTINQPITATPVMTPTKENIPTHQEIQLGLNDVAVWTDAQGITHHVNSDGLDYQTIAGTNQAHYADWYGSLPATAQITHQQEVQLDLKDIATWTDAQGITHHVDSDGTDYQTNPDHTHQYADWYNSIPANAQIIHSN